MVEFTSDLIYDLERRDFTINAMAYNPEEGLIDPYCGYEDIQDRRIRCVGNPDDRFREDGLRILRALRFSVQLGFKIELFTKRAMIDNRSLLNKISFERINSEFLKIIDSPNSHHARMLLLEFEDVLAEFIPELKSTFGFEQNNPFHRYPVYEHILTVLKECTDTDIITKLAAFFHDIGKPHCYQDDKNGMRHFKGHGKVSADMTDSYYA